MRYNAIQFVTRLVTGTKLALISFLSLCLRQSSFSPYNFQAAIRSFLEFFPKGIACVDPLTKSYRCDTISLYDFSFSVVEGTEETAAVIDAASSLTVKIGCGRCAIRLTKR